MRELNISTFIQIMQIGLKKHDTQFSAGTFLLEALNQPDDERFDIYREDLSDNKISLLVSRQRPVPDGIKQASLVPELAKAALDQDELLDFYDKAQEGRFLGEVFLYVVDRPNKPGEDFVGFEDAPLIAEANYECPICHKKLVDTVKK